MFGKTIVDGQKMIERVQNATNTFLDVIYIGRSKIIDGSLNSKEYALDLIRETIKCMTAVNSIIIELRSEDSKEQRSKNRNIFMACSALEMLEETLKPCVDARIRNYKFELYDMDDAISASERIIFLADGLIDSQSE